MKWGWLKRVGRIVAMPVTAPAAAVKKGVEKTMLTAILGIVRHLLTWGGGFLWTGDDLTQFVGAAMSIVGLVWSLLQKRGVLP